MPRVERDSLGEMEIPDSVYYGVQTARALVNFPVSGIREHPAFIRSYVEIKKAAAQANIQLGKLDRDKGEAILKAAEELLSGGLNDQFPVDVFQAGAGTSFNMNVNEVLANRALEFMGKAKGDYESLNPNDHVNMSQSTNDTFPTAAHLAVLALSEPLLKSLHDLSDCFSRKGEEFRNIPKTGRTHLMDATPLTLGDEFRAYAAALRRSAVRIAQRRDDLLELPIGGTATGTGVNAPPGYMETVVGFLSANIKMAFRCAQDSFEMLQSRSHLAAFSGSLRECAQELIRIANDLRLLGSGPTSGFSEIVLPAVQPGSSIMPGKVNPVMAECLDMVCFQVIGNDTAVSLAAQAGQLELNVMTPVMIHNIVSSMDLFNHFLPVFRKRCVEDIRANEEKCRSYLERNPSLATLLNPRIGYLNAAKIAKESYEKGIPVPELAIAKGILTREEAEEMFSPRNIVGKRKRE
ncbi:MAG: aspartate ammonia-lyase [Deltaproteobacteria bacterium HGW-Deltaproteobacteria-21]|nr:MAG: aspartate ammonia-lyase [Deltaproteobacteria bacterium HGW-Deltaproteobacteria-21]